ncbi:MAG: hypothetical protein PHD15_04475 [Clostridia bacterium]|nr:hypothetical protein [Clostridia bacterium]MDD4386995.1 hypothetical protein [Clostridia bacterium]
MKKKLVLVFSLLLVFVVGYVVYTNNNKRNLVAENQVQTQVEKILTYVTIDINPSIELAVDEGDIVVDAITLNEDADIAYSDLALIGQTVENATEIIVNTAIDLGYITEISDTNAVNITSYIEDEARRDSLNKKIVANLNKHFETRKIYALVIENGLDDELKSKADTYNIPYGKMLLVSRAMQLDSTLVESDLVNLSVKEIQSSIKTQAVARRAEFKEIAIYGKQEFKDIKTQRVAEAKIKLQNDKALLLKNTGNSSELNSQQKETLIEQRKEEIKVEIQGVKEDLSQNGNTIKEEIKETVRDKYLLKKKQ